MPIDPPPAAGGLPAAAAPHPTHPHTHTPPPPHARAHAYTCPPAQASGGGGGLVRGLLSAGLGFMGARGLVGSRPQQQPGEYGAVMVFVVGGISPAEVREVGERGGGGEGACGAARAKAAGAGSSRPVQAHALFTMALMSQH